MGDWVRSNELDDGTYECFWIKSDDTLSFISQPDLPDGTAPWTIIQLRFLCRNSSKTGGMISVQFRTGTPGVGPSDTILDSFTIKESDLNVDLTWMDFNCDITINTPSEDGVLCLWFRAYI